MLSMYLSAYSLYSASHKIIFACKDTKKTSIMQEGSAFFCKKDIEK